MKHTALNAQQLRDMLIAGAASLARNKEEINSLNVFPVPDGDTGTNMNLTVEAANKEMNKLSGEFTVNQVSEALSMGSLMGARGNSGVILSQLFRGIAKHLGGQTEITPLAFATALQEGVDTAYKAVIRPVEGTILTVSKNAAKAAIKAAKGAGDINTLLETVIQEANSTLDKTPEMLPVLKQAGVVDAGGKGLCYIYQGWYNFLAGREDVVTPTRDYKPVDFAPTDTEDFNLDYPYCTEFIVTGEGLKEEVFRGALDSHGDSLLVVGTSGLIKIHIHTNNPGKVLDFALTQGKELQDIKIENMRLQHSELTAKEEPQEPKLNGVIAVASGKGLEEIFQSMGVDHVVVGGQTMNPSTEDFLNAMEKVNAKRLILLPNNSNIIMAAKQAAEVSDGEVAVIPAKTIPQGLSVMLNYAPEEEDFAGLVEAMESGIGSVKTGQVTFAVRDSVFDGKPIVEGNILGIADGKIVSVDEKVSDVTLDLVGQMVDDDSEIITLFYGEEVDRKDAQELAEKLEELHPDCEVELHPGGQPLYFYIIAIE